MEAPIEAIELFQRAAIALGIGLLMGLERGWQAREGAEGTRVAGIRTFGLIGLGGAVWFELGNYLGDVVQSVIFLAIVGVLTGFYLRARSHTRSNINGREDVGVTTLVAAILTFLLGALAMTGEIALAAASGVIATLLLGTKQQIHGLIARIEYSELMAVVKLLIMSVVLLPVLPNQGYGPWAALNPFELWVIVVFIAGLSFAGYMAVRIAGAERGIMFASLGGGLVSSTAVTISWSRLARTNPEQWRLFASGITLACGMMFLRSLVVAAVIAPSLLYPLAGPLIAASLTAMALSAIMWRSQAHAPTAGHLDLMNPFEFGTAVKFGVLLAAIVLATRAAQEWLGDPGVIALAALAGAADVDAITVSLSRITGDAIIADVTVMGILIASSSNTLVKSVIALFAGDQRAGGAVATAMALSITAGALAWWLV